MPTPAHDDEATTAPAPGLPRWLTFDRMLTLVSLVFASGCFFAAVSSLGTRVEKLELWKESQNTAISDIKADVKVLLERTEPKR
jgi:hypothetical protein